ncbi:MAG: tRNA U-34 5-methylaminomethyl-2-thiouridine biosynthesis protein [Gammaproteobacteria bacterium]|nr:tRNA U-34 5-methylaminomethyl-2-thiouridine biosynthesis protein [Gammaproteobacteria bacterium]NNM00739.1 tRNA U-34 5-methylaminomethyl-2-thiouridine biosynthesis protein [Gammaproteobacteria bacterium]
MTVACAFLVPGSPLPFVQPDNPPWGRLADAMDAAGSALVAAAPDTIVVYSTQWIAVLDQLWQTRPHLSGVHVDENWHEYGDLPFDIRIDTELAAAAIDATGEHGIRSKAVDYDAFPIDTGTIVAARFLNPDNRLPLVITSNNVYHDWDMTTALGRVAAEQAERLGRRIAVVGVGGLSGSFFRHDIDISEDRIASDAEDRWNRDMLALLEQGDSAALAEACPRYAAEARVDMGFKHFAFILGALGGGYAGATVHGYEPLYGAGGGVVEFQPD